MSALRWNGCPRVRDDDHGRRGDGGGDGRDTGVGDRRGPDPQFDPGRGGGRRSGMRVVALGAGAAVAGTALLAASGWLVTRAAEQPPVLALLAAIVVVRTLGLVRAFGRYGERIAAHDAAFRRLAEVRVAWYRRLVAEPSAAASPSRREPAGRLDPRDAGEPLAAPGDADRPLGLRLRAWAGSRARRRRGSAIAEAGAAGSGCPPTGGGGGAPAADLLSRFVVDVDELQHREVRVRWPPVVAAVAGVATTAMAIAILPAAGLVLGGGLLAAATVVPGVAWWAARGALRRQAAARATLTDELVEAMDAAPQLALAGRGHERLARLDAASAQLDRIGRRDAGAAAAAQTLGALVSGATLVGVLLVAVGPTQDGALAPVWLGALALLTLGAFEAVGALPEAAVRAVGVAAAERRLAEAVAPTRTARAAPPTASSPATDPPASAPADLTAAGPDAPTRIRSGPPAAPTPPDRGLAADAALVARGVRHRPGGAGAAVVLDGVDLALAPGRRIGLVGASGAGKTVLAHLLAGLARPDEGRIELGGVALDRLDAATVRAHVRLAGQDAHLFATSIANNVRIGAPEATDVQVAAALRATGLDAWLDALPDGVDTLVGEQGFAVSGGQRQRIALARCLVSPARLLLLDEPTAMLDPPAARAFLADMDRAVGDRGVLVVTHERVGLEAFDEVLELRDGRLRRLKERTAAPAG